MDFRQPIMIKKLIVLACFIAVFIITALILKTSQPPLSEQELNNLSTVVKQVFSRPSQPDGSAAQNQQSDAKSILAIIYIRPNSTWFFKATGNTALIDAQSREFARLFLDELTFDDNNYPQLTHIPPKYITDSNEPMRIASYNINDMQVAVSKLPTPQDIDANINRWKNQLGLSPDAPQFVKYQDNNTTVLVRLDQSVPSTKTSSPKPPQKENLADFVELNLSDNWQIQDTVSGMASGGLISQGISPKLEVSILRLPANVPQETIFGIWEERLGVNNTQATPPLELSSRHNQTWQIYQLTGEQQSILIGMHQGKTRYTFFRLGNGGMLDGSVLAQFEALLSNVKITQE